jgi:membrane AbrB-like protein
VAKPKCKSLTTGWRRGIDRRSMPQAPASSQKLLRIAESLLIGATGGFLFNAAKFPAGWLAGSMVFAAAAALAGRLIHVPRPLARVCSVVLGIAIGGVVTPETLGGMMTWPLSIAMVLISVAAATLAAFAYLTRVHGWNAVTAIFASVPGGLAQVMALATEERHNCDIRGVAIVQTLRVMILTVVVPTALSLAGRAGAARPSVSSFAVVEAPVGFAFLVGAASAAALGLLQLGFRGGMFFGPLAVSAALHGGAFIEVRMPSWLAIAAMVGLGTLSGGRFTGMPFRLLLGYLGAALGAFVVSLVVTAAVAIAVTRAAPLPVAEVVVAYAPGAVDAMMILALALNLDPVFVGAHHLARVFVVSLGLPILAHYFSTPGTKRSESGEPVPPRGDGLDD